jgi:hypothetical protein
MATIEVKPMDESFILIPCLHGGPVDPKAPPQKGRDWIEADDLPPQPWDDRTLTDLAGRYRIMTHGPAGDAAREFMREMTRRHGACAILAWEEGKVVGLLRFYPMKEARIMAASQDDPSPVLDCTAACEPDDDEGTLWVQCLMTCRPYEDAEGARRAGGRKGLGLRLAKALLSWAGEHGWRRIVKVAHCDLDWFYGIQGGGGKAFWERAGFTVAGSFHRKAFDFGDEDDHIVRAQMAEKGMTEKDIWTWYRMVYEL